MCARTKVCTAGACRATNHKHACVVESRCSWSTEAEEAAAAYYVILPPLDLHAVPAATLLTPTRYIRANARSRNSCGSHGVFLARDAAEMDDVRRAVRAAATRSGAAMGLLGALVQA